MKEITAYRLATTDRPALTVASLEEPDYTENDIVHYDDAGHVGVVLEVRTEDFTWEADGEEHSVEASSDDPVFVVSLETGGTGLFAKEDLDETPDDDALADVDTDGISDVEDAELGQAYDEYSEAELAQAYTELDGCTDCAIAELRSIDVPLAEDPGVGWSSYPDSWEESETPNRKILLDAWLSMGGSFRGCRREMKGKVRRVNAFCASMKDTVYGFEGWRSGGD